METFQWLPAIVFSMWLGWTGWNEYSKRSSYRRWSKQFDKTKYDVYSVLGKYGEELTWAKPTSSGPIEMNSFSLRNVKAIRLTVDDRPIELDKLPSKGFALIEFLIQDPKTVIKVPFADLKEAAEWTRDLQEERQKISQ
jgi:hypothetical protein